MRSAPLRLFGADIHRDIPFLARVLTLALLVGGALGALTSFALARGFWVWRMPDLAYRFLAGAAAASTEAIVYIVFFAVVAVDSIVLWAQGAFAARRLAPG